MPDKDWLQQLLSKVDELGVGAYPSGTSENRSAVIDLLGKLLGTKTQPPAELPSYVPRLKSFDGRTLTKAPSIFSLSNPAPYEKTGQVEDPHAELATLLMQREHPHAMNKTASIRLGLPLGDGILGQTERAITGEPIISLAPTKSVFDATSTLAHELGHGALRLTDKSRFDNPDNADGSKPFGGAYDFDLLYNDLNRDIHLPKDK